MGSKKRRRDIIIGGNGDVDLEIRVRDEELLRSVGEERDVLKTIRRKNNVLEHVM